MSALREVIALFDVDFNTKPLERGNSRIEAVIGKLKAFGAAIAGSAIVVGLRNMVSELEQQASALDDSATRLGLGAEELQLYRFAAKQAGVEVGAFDQALNILTLNQGAAAEGSKAQSEAFKALGIEAKGAALGEMTLSDLLPQIAEGLSKVESNSERARMAQQLFGKQGVKLAPMLGEGAAGIEKFRKEIALLGGGFTQDAVKDLAEYGDTMDKLDLSVTSVKISLAKGIIPTLTRWTTAVAFGIGRVSRFIGSIRDTAKQSNILSGVFAVMGSAGVSKVFALAGGWKGIGSIILQASRYLAAFLLRLALPALIIDELITTWQGGDTIIRRSLDSLFGDGMTARIVGFFKVMTGGWQGFWTIVDNGAIMLGAIIAGTADEIGTSFAMAFGGAQDAAGAAFNWILSQAQAVVAKVAKLLSSIPGAGELAGAITAKIEGFKADGGNLDERRTSRVEVFERASSNISTAIANVNAPVTNNITVPPGTPASIASRVGNAAGKATAPSRRATQAALVSRAR